MAVQAPPKPPEYVPAPVDVEPVDILAPPAQSMDAPPPGSAPSILSRVIYLGLLVIPALLTILVLLARTGVIGRLPQSGKTEWALGAIVGASVVVTVVSFLVARRAPKLVERSRNDAAMDAAVAKWEVRLLAASLPVGAALMAAAWLAWLNILPLEPLAPPLLGAAAILATCGPLGYFSYVNAKRVSQIEERFPDFLRDLNESYSAGLTMAQAIRVAARGDYGLLNPEIRRMANQVSWGAPFTDALHMFAERVGTPIVMRAVALINKATRAGGNAKEVLAAAARDAREIRAIQQERKLSMTLYVIVIYVAFGVFLSVVAALQGLLVPALLTATRGAAGAPGLVSAVSGGVVGPLGFVDFRLIYFSIGLVQAVGSGIVAGVMAEGSYAAGLKHVVIMTAASAVVLGLLL